MKAFYCHSDWCEESALVFAETAGKAKWWFINHRCDGDMAGVTCRREKKLDHYGSAEIIAGRLLARPGPRPAVFTKWCPPPGRGP